MCKLQSFYGKIVLARVQVRSYPLDRKRLQDLTLKYIVASRRILDCNGAVAELHRSPHDGEIPAPHNVVDDPTFQCEVALFAPRREFPAMGVQAPFVILLDFRFQL